MTHLVENPLTVVEAFRRQLVATQGQGLALRALDFVVSAANTAGRESLLDSAISVGEILLALESDAETIAAALIVGAFSRNQIDARLLTEAFGPDVVALVTGVLRTGRLDSINGAQSAETRGAQPGGEAAAVEALRKMMLAMADDVRVVLIRLAERVVLMRGMTKAPDDQRRAVAQHTRDLFAPLANRLGVFAIKWELEDLAFRFLEPETYKRIAQQLDSKRGERERDIATLLKTLRDGLDKAGLKAELAGRPKHIWSIHRKMMAKHLAFESVYDVRAVRILVDTTAECYAALSLVHEWWQPVEGEFDDYIAQPKANNYQSLHTAVIGPDGKTLEVQIRTRDMHAASEHGVAAHWRYKEGGGHTSADKKFEEKIGWLRQVLEWKRELVNSSQFSEQVKQGLFNDTIYVFTPQGRVVDLPAGSTPVDFAYHVHTDLGHRCRGAKVDGVMVPLNTALQNAQRVEILAAKQGGPSRDWINPQLGFLASHRAQTKVRAWFRQEYFEVDVAHGRQILDREMARAGASSVALEKVAQALNHKKMDDCLAEIGRGEITPHQIEVALRELSAAKPAQSATQTVDEFKVAAQSTQAHKVSDGVLVLGLNNIATMVAKCCKPLPGDAIVGFVTRSRGVMVHRQDCANIVCLTPDQRDRLMPVEWGRSADQPYSADIELLATDRQGLLRDVSEALSHERINVTAVNTMTRGNTATMRFTVELRRGEDLERLLRAVGAVRGVESVKRR